MADVSPDEFKEVLAEARAEGDMSPDQRRQQVPGEINGVMISRPQESHADLGLVNDDNTPDMRKAPADTGAQRSSNRPTTEGNLNADSTRS